MALVFSWARQHNVCWCRLLLTVSFGPVLYFGEQQLLVGRIRLLMSCGSPCYILSLD